MEHRLVIAYGLIAAIAVAALVVGVLASRRRAARKRRLRGIKDYDKARVQGLAQAGRPKVPLS